MRRLSVATSKPLRDTRALCRLFRERFATLADELDPGFGFGWPAARNIEMLRRLGELRDLGLPLLVGTSRKSTIGAVLDGAPVEERLFGTAATVGLAIAGGADIVRVHDVRAMRDVARVSDAIVRGWEES